MLPIVMVDVYTDKALSGDQQMNSDCMWCTHGLMCIICHSSPHIPLKSHCSEIKQVALCEASVGRHVGDNSYHKLD